MHVRHHHHKNIGRHGIVAPGGENVPLHLQAVETQEAVLFEESNGMSRGP